MLDYTRWPLTVHWWPKNVGFPPRNHQWANNVFSRSGPVLIYNQWPKGTFVVAFQRLFATITPPVVSQWQSNIYLLLLDHCWSASDLPPSFCHLTAHKWLAHWVLIIMITSLIFNYVIRAIVPLFACWIISVPSIMTEVGEVPHYFFESITLPPNMFTTLKSIFPHIVYSRTFITCNCEIPYATSC